MAKQITDMKTWLLDSEGKIYRYVIYRRMFTPYEQEHAFSDESQYEDIHFTFGFIEDAIELGGGEWLLGFRKIDGDEVYDEIEYCRLSEIRLSYFDCDQKGIIKDTSDAPDMEEAEELIVETTN